MEHHDHALTVSEGHQIHLAGLTLIHYLQSGDLYRLGRQLIEYSHEGFVLAVERLLEYASYPVEVIEEALDSTQNCEIKHLLLCHITMD